MVVEVKGNSANELFVNVANEMLTSGHYNNPRGLKTLELSDAWLTLYNPKDNIVSLTSRSMSMDYLLGEQEWYNSGSLSAKDIGKHSKFWLKLADKDGNVCSNYGLLTKIDKYNGKSQLDWCIESLLKDSNSRQAVMNYNQPRHKFDGNKDFVCTLSQQFVKRDGCLDSIVMMRSNDLVYGLTYDLPWFCNLQVEVSEKTGIPLGNYHHYATSLHVYEGHFGMLESISKDK